MTSEVIEPTTANGNRSVPPMPEAIAKAIIQIMKKIETIEKSSYNKYSDYNYASVDAFVEATRPVCAEAGLAVIPMEIERSFSREDGKNVIAVFTYQFLLIHETGATWTTSLDQRSVRQIWLGAQTSGAAQSYAFKQYLRALFQIATGEPDADAEPKVPTAPSSPQRRPAIQQRAADDQARRDIAAPPGVYESNGTAAEPSAVLTAYETALDNARTEDGVKYVSKEHKPAIATLDSDGKEVARRMQRKALIRAKAAAAQPPAQAAE